MTSRRQFVALLALACFFSTLTAAAAGPSREDPLDAAFKAYCAQGGGDLPWFCGTRETTLSMAHKFDILNGYCTGDRISGRPAPDEAVCKAFHALEPPLVLEFESATGKWSHRGGFEARRIDVEYDSLTRLPLAYLGKRGNVSVVVVGNPLRMSVNRGAAKETDVPQVAMLEKLLESAAVLAGGLPGALSSAWSTRMATLQRTDTQDTMRSAERRPASVLAMPRLAVDVEDETALDASAYESDLAIVRGQVKAVATQTRRLRAELDKLRQSQRAFQLLAQRLDAEAAPIDMALLNQALENPAAWASLFEDVGKQVAAVPAVAAWTPFFESTAAALTADPSKPPAAYDAVIRALDQQPDLSACSSPCADSAYRARVVETLGMVATAASLASRAPSNAIAQTALRTALVDARERHLLHLLALGRAFQSLHTMKGAVAEALSQEEATRSAAMQLASTSRGVRDSATRRVGMAVVRIERKIYVPDEAFDVSWTKIREFPLVIAPASSAADGGGTAVKEKTTSYRLARKAANRVSVGAGLIFTGAHSSVYGAVDTAPGVTTNVSTTTKTEDAETGSTTTTTVAQVEPKELIEKERQSRSGTIGLFLSYRMTQSEDWGAGVQFGFGTSDPAFLVGPVLYLSRYLTFSGGAAWFRVNRLGLGFNGREQQVGDVVFSADEVRSRDRWPLSYYLSISANVSGLPIFKK